MMAINLERTAMQGRLAEAERKQTALKSKFEALARSIRTGLNTALTPAVDIEVPELSQLWDDLVLTWGELLGTRLDIERLKRELGN